MLISKQYFDIKGTRYWYLNYVLHIAYNCSHIVGYLKEDSIRVVRKDFAEVVKNGIQYLYIINVS